MNRKHVINHNYFKLALVSAFVGLLSAMLAFTLKHITEFAEQFIHSKAISFHHAIIILLPTIGITAIYFLRKYVFKGRKNKGITEIYKTLDQRKEHLPFFKMPSHYLNGFLTVIFGGSTGVEVSTVVATATMGNFLHEKEYTARTYKRELICAGVTAGVAILFVSPLAGWLFAMEVIARKFRKTLLISCTASALVSWLIIYFIEHEPILSMPVVDWNWYAMPFFILLSVLGGTLSVYFTLLVTNMKRIFGNINNNFLRVNIGALLVGAMLFVYPALYGDSYHGLSSVLNTEMIPVLTLIFLMLLKPLASSLTLGAGGDGGVFAPSIVAGAFLGLAVATVCNQFFGLNVIPLNFALVGAAATLSASIYAPFTALILICNIAPNAYALFIPLLIGSWIAKLFSQILLPYNVYTHAEYLTKHTLAHQVKA